MLPRLISLLVLCASSVFSAPPGATPESPQQPPKSVAPYLPANWKAGTATVKVTPQKFLWMAGYAARKKPAEGKVQEGWRLSDIIALYVKEKLPDAATVTVRSSSRNKAVTLTWAEVHEEANQVMFDLSNRGTLKLVSVMPKLDEREEWVQDADRIEIARP